MFNVHEILFIKVTVNATTKNAYSEDDVNIWIMLLWIKSGEIHIHFSNHHTPHALNLSPDALLKILIALVMLCDFSLPPQYKWGLHSSGMLHNEWYVSVQPIGCETLASTSVTGNNAD